MTVVTTNPIQIFLSLPVNAPQSSVFKKFCTTVSVSEDAGEKVLYLRASSAVSEGAYLRVAVIGGDGKEWVCRIPNQHILIVIDVPDAQRAIGFGPR